MKKAVFLDRDGTINEKPKEHHYIKHLSDFKKKLFPNVKENIKKIKKAGYIVIIITNQAGINKGIIDESEYNKIVKFLTEIGIDKVYTCPHNYLKEKCRCRKPSPLMILRASTEWKIDRTNSWMIGDDDIDLKSGADAECKLFRGTIQEFVDKELIKNG